MSNGWRALRMAAGLSLRDAAESTEIPIVRLGEIERTVRAATASELDKMARIYGAAWDKANPREPRPWETVNAEPESEPGEYEQLIANTCSREEARRRMDHAEAVLSKLLPRVSVAVNQQMFKQLQERAARCSELEQLAAEVVGALRDRQKLNPSSGAFKRAADLVAEKLGVK
jgi:transcriptional regulator with XRE-family HTH domain